MDLILNIDVPDLPRAEAFYCSAFGLRSARRLGATILELLGGAVPIYLLLKGDASAPFAGASSLRTYARHWTPLHLDLTVADLEASRLRVLAAGATQEGPAEVHPRGKLAMFSDPFGHGFCLIEFSNKGYDEIACG